MQQPFYDIARINERLKTDKHTFIAECEDDYDRKVELAAGLIAKRRSVSPIVLLSGPSGSGKTTTAMRLDDKLKTLGIEAYTISLDDYFLSPHRPDAPKTKSGEPDFESPACIDWTLLNEHFSKLESGEPVEVPHFDFTVQDRGEKVTPLQLGSDEVAIFEGIHALSTLITDKHPQAFKLYISARSDFRLNGEIAFKHTWSRILRRTIRDSLFRGAPASVTLKMWHNVREGEKLYISPYKDGADLQLDTTHPYETNLLRLRAESILEDSPENFERVAELRALLSPLPRFDYLEEDAVPEFSMLREFIGGGIYEY